MSVGRSSAQSTSRLRMRANRNAPAKAAPTAPRGARAAASGVPAGRRLGAARRRRRRAAASDRSDAEAGRRHVGAGDGRGRRCGAARLLGRARRALLARALGLGLRPPRARSSASRSLARELRLSFSAASSASCGLRQLLLGAALVGLRDLLAHSAARASASVRSAWASPRRSPRSAAACRGGLDTRLSSPAATAPGFCGSSLTRADLPRRRGRQISVRDAAWSRSRPARRCRRAGRTRPGA